MNILLSFKNEDDVNYLLKFLNSEYKVIFATNIVESKYILKNDQIDVIVSDFQFNDGTVFELLDFKIPIIILSEIENINTALIFLKKGLNDCIIKDNNRKYFEMIPYYIEKIINNQNRIAKINRTHKQNKLFLSNVSHELRTPLNSILGFAALLFEEETNEKKSQKLKIIRDSGNYLLNIVNDILDLSKIESGKLNLEKIDFLLINTINHLQNLFSFQASEKKIDFKIIIDDTVPNLVKGDELRISQVLINILSNSFKFTPINGRIRLICRYSDGIVHFRISDTGIGIPSTKIKKLFRPFEQLDSSTSRKYGGTGLGLAISKNIIELMGGKISVKSKINKGTLFFIDIPIITIDPDKIEITEKESKKENRGIEMVKKWIDKMGDEKIFKTVILSGVANLPERISEIEKAIKDNDLNNIKYFAHQLKGFTGSYGMEEIYNIANPMYELINSDNYKKETILANIEKIKKIIATIPSEYFKKSKSTEIIKKNRTEAKILVAEDNLENQLLIKAFFESFELSCDIADNGLIALEMLKKKKYDILFLDMQMPVMDGLTTIKKIREDDELKKLYVIALTADTMIGNKERIIAAGCDDFLSKPLKKEILREKLNSLLV